MIAFNYANILALRLRYTVDEHSGEILEPLFFRFKNV